MSEQQPDQLERAAPQNASVRIGQLVKVTCQRCGHSGFIHHEVVRVVVCSSCGHRATRGAGYD
jgi:ribosomal protein S27E